MHQCDRVAASAAPGWTQATALLMWFARKCFVRSEVTDEMVVTAQRGGLPKDLEQRVLERAYFLFIDGASEDQCQNYFEALRIELGLLWGS